MPRLVVASVLVLLVSCGGGSPLEPPQAPDPPSTAAAPAVSAAVEAAATTTTTAVTVDVEPSTTTAAVDSSTTTAAAGSELSVEIVTPPTTVSENALIDAGESVRVQALEAMLRDLAPAQVVLVSFFYVTDERVVADFCVEESSAGGVTYRHVARGVDLESSEWEISGRFDMAVFDELEPCAASFN